MTTDLFSRAEPAWLNIPDSEAKSDPITLLSSFRLRRNIEGFPFPARCGKSDLYDLAALILGCLGRSSAWGECEFRMIDNLDNLSRHLLLEMKMISSRFALGGAGRFLLRDDDGTMSCMINEDEHFSLSAIYPGLDLDAARGRAEHLAESMDVKWLSDPVLGYLTSNPAYVGTGVTASVLFHLPALDVTGGISKIAVNFQNEWNNLEFFKLLSNESSSCGSFYLLSNKTTLSVTVEDIIESVTEAARSLAERELFSRQEIQKAREGEIMDRFWRAWGLLRHAKRLPFPEAAEAFSFVKLGSDLGMLPRVDNREWRRMLIGAQRYHLSLNSPEIIDISEEPYVRAAMFRQYIENRSSSTNTKEVQ
jgi:protein arginine kinase